MRLLKIMLAGAALASAAALAQEATSLQSDWIELVKGHKGATLGVELRDIQPSEGDGMQTVTLAVPKGSLANTDYIEEVVVTARGPEAKEPLEPIKVQYQWLDDYDEDNYGLVIKIGEGNWPIRLYLNSSAGFIGDQ